MTQVKKKIFFFKIKLDELVLDALESHWELKPSLF